MQKVVTIKKLLVCIFVLGLSSCLPEYEIKHDGTSVVIGKDQILIKGNTRYVVAFDNGMTKTIPFGEYCKINIGDTLDIWTSNYGGTELRNWRKK
jgi:hypothetical protein